MALRVENLPRALPAKTDVPPFSTGNAQLHLDHDLDGQTAGQLPQRTRTRALRA
jgi:hypothetical protein